MANTINADWDEMSLTFNLAMLIMLLCVALMYFIQARFKEQDIGAAKNMLVILPIDCLLYFTAFIASLLQAGVAVIWIDVAAVLVGAFLPFFIRGNFDISIISFPHLAERFELITIITFGEGIVGMTDFFDVRNFSVQPILVFAVILILFGCYVTQIHYLCYHHRVDRSLRLMFSHYFIVIAVNLITIAFKFLENPEASRLFTSLLMTAALVLFYISCYSDSIYYHEEVTFGLRDASFSIAALVVGAVIMILAGNNTYLFLLGAIIGVGGNFCMLLMKYKIIRVIHRRYLK